MRKAAETTISRTVSRLSVAALLAAGIPAGGDALALSNLGADRAPPSAPRSGQGEVLEAFEGTTLPAPDPAINRTQPDPQEDPAPASEPETAEDKPDEAEPAVEIILDMSKLPQPVRQMREQIVEAAASGDIERLRPLLGSGDDQTQVMNGESDDPVDTLKSFSGDAEGQEILAILLDILSTGAARSDVGTADEAYVWPYFTGKPLSTLTPPERVDLLRIVTAGDLAGMEENGNYNFYRLGIGPDGKWKFFSGGD